MTSTSKQPPKLSISSFLYEIWVQKGKWTFPELSSEKLVKFELNPTQPILATNRCCVQYIRQSYPPPRKGICCSMCPTIIHRSIALSMLWQDSWLKAISRPYSTTIRQLFSNFHVCLNSEGLQCFLNKWTNAQKYLLF